MSKLLNNKTLVIIFCCLIVLGIVLTVIIININSDKSSGTDNSQEETLVQLSETDVKNSNTNSNIDKSGISMDQQNANLANPDNNTAQGDESSPDKADENNTKSEPWITKLCEYKGVTLEYKPVIVTEEMVDSEIEKLKTDYTEIVDLPNRAFEEGDMAIVTFEGKIDDYRPDEFLGVCVQDILGTGALPEEFEQVIIGRSIGDKFSVPLDFPEDYTLVPEAAGKTIDFEITLDDGFMFKIPEINDSFISKVTEYKDLKSYREGTKAKLQENENKIAYEATMLSLKQNLIENTVFSDAVDNDIKLAYVTMLNDEKQYIAENYYIDPDTFYQIEYDMTLDEYQNKMMEELTLSVKYSYILDKIVEEESISDKDITSEEFESAFNKIYIENGAYYSKEYVYAEKTEKEINKTVNTEVLRDKAEKLVLEAAVINGENNIPW